MPCMNTSWVYQWKESFFFLLNKDSSSGCPHCVTDGCELLVGSPLSLTFWDYRSVTTPGYKAVLKKKNHRSYILIENGGIYVLAVMGIEPKALHMLGRQSFMIPHFPVLRK